MRLFGQVLGGIFIHIALVIILAFLGMFIWNTGVVGLIDTLNPITFGIASAIMTGIVIVNLFARIWFKRYTNYKLEKMMIEHFQKTSQKPYNKKKHD